MKKKKPLKIILIVLAALLLLPILVPGLTFLFVAAAWDFSSNLELRENKREIFSCVVEQRATKEATLPEKATAFYYDHDGFYYQGYYYSPDDTYWRVDANSRNDSAACRRRLRENEAKRYKKGYRTEDRYYTEKICDNWYYFECPMDAM